MQARPLTWEITVRRVVARGTARRSAPVRAGGVTGLTRQRRRRASLPACHDVVRDGCHLWYGSSGAACRGRAGRRRAARLGSCHDPSACRTRAGGRLDRRPAPCR
ncbi:hypothetical protein Cph01nite_13480 [Cellulomonas phragmiteti]|uniref:Uncharacterized protein n=1 Tax=Cellulomonas phragmiteti TaxID=478780 RepID=A0ABQ4DJQ8_9CELL|nr:hypothetical protein Cph01nite_13480 [Cellulomonas phragmiteti]